MFLHGKFKKPIDFICLNAPGLFKYILRNHLMMTGCHRVSLLSCILLCNFCYWHKRNWGDVGSKGQFFSSMTEDITSQISFWRWVPSIWITLLIWACYYTICTSIYFPSFPSQDNLSRASSAFKYLSFLNLWGTLPSTDFLLDS